MHLASFFKAQRRDHSGGVEVLGKLQGSEMIRISIPKAGALCFCLNHLSERFVFQKESWTNSERRSGFCVLSVVKLGWREVKEQKQLKRKGSLNRRGQVDGGEGLSYQAKMKRPVQLLRGKGPIMANPPVSEVSTCDAVSNSQDFHPAHILIFQKSPFEARQQTRPMRRQGGSLKWVLLSLSKSDGWPAITQSGRRKSQAVTSCFNKETTKLYCSSTKWSHWIDDIYRYWFIKAANLSM